MKPTVKQVAAMRQRPDRFVVGYLAKGNVVFGKEIVSYVGPLTAAQAKRKLMLMPCSGAAIFELRPVNINR